jgi:hypothetical protein
LRTLGAEEKRLVKDEECCFISAIERGEVKVGIAHVEGVG